MCLRIPFLGDWTRPNSRGLCRITCSTSRSPPRCLLEIGAGGVFAPENTSTPPATPTWTTKGWSGASRASPCTSRARERTAFTGWPVQDKRMGASGSRRAAPVVRSVLSFRKVGVHRTLAFTLPTATGRTAPCGGLRFWVGASVSWPRMDATHPPPVPVLLGAWTSWSAALRLCSVCDASSSGARRGRPASLSFLAVGWGGAWSFDLNLRLCVFRVLVVLDFIVGCCFCCACCVSFVSAYFRRNSSRATAPQLANNFQS